MMDEVEVTPSKVNVVSVKPMHFWPVRFDNGPSQICFTWHEDGSVTVDDWCRWQFFSRDLLSGAPYSKTFSLHYAPEGVGGLVTIEVANGRAVYKIVGQHNKYPIVRGELIEAELDMPEGDWSSAVLW